MELLRDSRIDSVGLNERVDSLATRSIKKESKLEALNMIVSMCDLTTLEGEDTEGKVSQMVAKAIIPNPNDLDIKFDLAISFIAREENSSAIDIFLSIIKDDPTWKEEKAKVQLIELLDSLGPTSHEGRRGRRLLSSLIFS